MPLLTFGPQRFVKIPQHTISVHDGPGNQLERQPLQSYPTHSSGPLHTSLLRKLRYQGISGPITVVDGQTMPSLYMIYQWQVKDLEGRQRH